MHVMIDLETMGTTPDAPIVAIGACRFDEAGALYGGNPYNSFYRKVSLQSAVDSGAYMDPETVIWWLQQEPDAQREIVSGEASLSDVLRDFAEWLGRDEVLGVWGNGAAFDNVILAQSYRRVGQDVPWPFHLDRCYRTVKNFSDVPMDRQGTHHNALDDAISQARHLVQIWASKNSGFDGLRDVLADHALFSQGTFGADHEIGPLGPIKHLHEETGEIIDAPSDPFEYVDMLFLTADAIRRFMAQSGLASDEFTQFAREKLAILKARDWPAPKDGVPRKHMKAARGQNL